MRHASGVRASGRIAVVSWLGGAVSILPFAEDWFGLGERAANLALLTALASAFALGLLIHASARLRHVVATLAGPPRPRARALILVAVFASAGALGMLAGTALVGSR